MKKNIQKSFYGILISGLMISSAQAKESDISEMKNLDLCVNYSTLKSEEEKKAYFDELNKRGQLSYQDLDRLPTKTVASSSTICGMYMSLGKPIAEQSRQIRPMTFKAVHVYPDKYYVSQSGMIVSSYERKEGEMPPKLIAEKPAVEPPPVLYKHAK
ncbi:hypothetical protein QCB45_03015 [Thiomicrorhabdus sp. ZW0627]|uniref:hypothetical protein n=1 Tax=Thiomicrorhabdus sp. ZW0627 TaxID=3039774 RepID=UPI0024364456|nr:hypothetical protein [Thiomicrorhabdus sp. ZW0627]MDG6773290.1 hypothetical protein [Thiomicrorhabdus sp. ZW0627]